MVLARALSTATHARKRKRLASYRPVILGAAGIVSFFVIWETVSRLNILPAASLPPASESLTVLAGLMGNPSFWVITGQTMLSWALGLLLATVLAVPAGIALGTSRTAYRMFSLVIEALRPIPPVVMIPIVVLVLGASLPMKLFLITFGAFWVLLVQTFYGVRSVDPLLLEMSRSFRLNPRDTFVKIRLAGALPTMAAGFRVAATVALIVSIVSELVGGAPGLGREILVAESYANFALMYALILVSGLLGILVNALLKIATDRLLFWHPSVRKVSK